MSILNALLPEFYWSLMSDLQLKNGVRPLYSGKDSRKEHAQLQWLFQCIQMHMTLQHMSKANSDNLNDYQMEVDEAGVDGRLYSPIGYLMDEAEFDYMRASNHVSGFFFDDQYARDIVSNFIKWELTRDQAMLLMHMDLIHDNYKDDPFPQFRHAATHFGLFMPDKEGSYIPKIPRAVQPHLSLVH
jgi:hypothetical protein